MAERLLKPSDIPVTLYQNADSLRLATHLEESYYNVLEVAGLLDEALTASVQGDIGGASDEETAAHFAKNFSGSCARVQLAVLDPKGHLEDASDLFIRAFSGGRVAMLDIPCGCGAGAATLLTVISELRRASILPREPLDVMLVAGDKSDSAIQHANNIFTNLLPSLHDQAIFLTTRFVSWDMLDADSTTNLLNTWLTHGTECREHFVLIPNCSGFLANNLRRAEERLGEIFRWAGVRRSTIVWVEPQTKKALNTMWPSISSWISKKWSKYFRPSSNGQSPTPLISNSNVIHPLRSDSQHVVNLSLVRLVRNDP